jgi:hypothetical protein
MSAIETSLLGRKVYCCAPVSYNDPHAGLTGVIRSVIHDRGLIGEVGLQVEWQDGSLSIVTSVDGKRHRLLPEEE